MSQFNNLTIGFYLQSLFRILGEPRRFFDELPNETGFRKPAGFLVISSLFFTGASLIENDYTHPFLMGAILFFNALGMVLIASSAGYLVAFLTMRKRSPFNKFFSIYAFAAGAALLASWMPFICWFTELWEWWLIGIGMINGCGFNRKQAIMVIGISAALMILFFWVIHQTLFD